MTNKLQVQIEIEYKSETEAELTLFLPCEISSNPYYLHPDIVDCDKLMAGKYLIEDWGKYQSNTNTRFRVITIEVSDASKLDLEIDNTVRYIKEALTDIKKKNTLSPKKYIEFEI